MANIKNVSGQDLEVSWLGRIVFAGQEVEVDDDVVDSYACQVETWKRTDKPARRPARKRAPRAPRKPKVKEPVVEPNPENEEES